MGAGLARGLAGRLIAAGTVVAAVAGACAPGGDPQSPTPPGPAAGPRAVVAAPGAVDERDASAAPDDPTAALDAHLAATTPHVAILDPAALAELEARGFGLGELVVGTRATSTEELARTALGAVLDGADADVRAVLAEHPTALVSSIQGTRLFDRRWLRSPEMRFELIGVFDRLDRRVFHRGTCGEVRFVYRLAYTTQQGGAPMHGRLPMTVNVVFLLPGDDEVGSQAGIAPSEATASATAIPPGAHGACAEAAVAWRAPSTLRDAREVAGWLADHGALAPARRARWTLKSVETNLQTVRVQSTAHASMAGHVEYAMRVFHPTDGSFVAAPMENQLDVARLAADPALRAELIALLRAPETLRAIDQGTLHLPDRFAARGARSIAPRGLERPFNRPFRQVLRDDDLAELDLAGYETIRSPAALLRRLDGLSCTGCHQSRSIAGFHHVGDDAADAPAWSSLVSGRSPHLAAELDRRHVYVEAIARGSAPDETRPIAERQGHDGGFGSACGPGAPGEVEPGFAAWTCDAGLRCVALEGAEVGVCLDDDPIGAPCEAGLRVVGGRTPVGDRTAGLARLGCGDALGCSPNINGFALGACAGHCDDATPAATCMRMSDIDGLQACLRAGYPETECAARFQVARADRACDAAHPCRQDFVCARTGDGERGACVPPYFVFPLRLDGYPLKR